MTHSYIRFVWTNSLLGTRSCTFVFRSSSITDTSSAARMSTIRQIRQNPEPTTNLIAESICWFRRARKRRRKSIDREKNGSSNVTTTLLFVSCFLQFLLAVSAWSLLRLPSSRVPCTLHMDILTSSHRLQTCILQTNVESRVFYEPASSLSIQRQSIELPKFLCQAIRWP